MCEIYIVFFKNIKPFSLDLFDPGHIRFLKNIFYVKLMKSILSKVFIGFFTKKFITCN